MPTTVNVIHGDKTIVTAIYSTSTEALNPISLHLVQSFTYIISPPSFPNVRLGPFLLFNITEKEGNWLHKSKVVTTTYVSVHR